MKIKKVAIVGGTHGNEFTGTFLLRRWTNNPSEITRESFTTKTLWANPKAFYENKRYIDADLNRCFLRADLDNEAIHTYEGNRAKLINALLGPKGNPAFDFTFDIHTTTGNMGITLILIGEDQYQLRLAAFIKAHMPDVNLLCIPRELGQGNLSSVTPRMLGLEIGPVPQGLLRHDIFEQANEAMRLSLDYIHQVNKGDEPESGSNVEVFMLRGTVGFPVDDDGNICAMVHRELQDRDFKELKKGDAMFSTLNGETITFNEEKTAYPAFINEAAYYDLKIAFSLTDKISMPL